MKDFEAGWKLKDDIKTLCPEIGAYRKSQSANTHAISSYTHFAEVLAGGEFARMRSRVRGHSRLKGRNIIVHISNFLKIIVCTGIKNQTVTAHEL